MSSKDIVKFSSKSVFIHLKMLFFLFLIILAQFSFQLRGKEKKVGIFETDNSINSMLTFYKTQGIITDPGKYEYLYNEFPGDVSKLVKIAQGLLIHIFHAHRYGVRLSEERKQEVNIRKVEDMLKRIKDMDDHPIVFTRTLQNRLVGNCRDYSVFMCSLLRYKGIPARARCGFATYFTPGKYEDHWVCEYWSENENRWVMIDPQLDSVQIKALNIDFNVFDVPPGKFLTAGETWNLCRNGELDPSFCGIFDLKGLWFVRGNVLRDLMALNKLEVLPWDCNEFMLNDTIISPEENDLLDKIANLTRKGTMSFNEYRYIYESFKILHMPEDWKP